MPHTFTPDEVLARLEILHRKLDGEGMYVRANTVWLAIEEIKRLSQAEELWNKRPSGSGDGQQH